MAHHHTYIIVVVVVAASLVAILGVVIYYRLYYGSNKRSEPNTQHRMDSVMPERDARRSGSYTSANAHMSLEMERAQKFRDRAKTVVIGKPAFKLSTKGSSVADTGKAKSKPGYASNDNSGSSISQQHRLMNAIQHQIGGGGAGAGSGTGADIENQNGTFTPNLDPNARYSPDEPYLEAKSKFQYTRINSLRNIRTNGGGGVEPDNANLSSRKSSADGGGSSPSRPQSQPQTQTQSQTLSSRPNVSSPELALYQQEQQHQGQGQGQSNSNKSSGSVSNSKDRSPRGNILYSPPPLYAQQDSPQIVQDRHHSQQHQQQLTQQSPITTATTTTALNSSSSRSVSPRATKPLSATTAASAAGTTENKPRQPQHAPPVSPYRPQQQQQQQQQQGSEQDQATLNQSANSQQEEASEYGLNESPRGGRSPHLQHTTSLATSTGPGTASSYSNTSSTAKSSPTIPYNDGTIINGALHVSHDELDTSQDNGKATQQQVLVLTPKHSPRPTTTNSSNQRREVFQ